MRKLFFLFAIVFLVGGSLAAVQQEIYADKDKAMVNTTVQVDCDPSTANCPVNYWTLDWSKPQGSEILSIKDSYGPVEDYTVKGDQIKITTNRGEKRTNETVQIKMLVEEDAEEIHAGLRKRTFSLPGFDGSRTTGFVEAPELVSGRTGFGFESSFSRNRMKFRGEGPVNLRIKTGEGNETRYFSFFGAALNRTEISYEVPVGMLGTVQDFERFPVAVMDDSTYNRKVNEWSAGEYFSGAIQIRSPESAGEDFLPVLAHEVVHGLNDRELKWDQTRSSYFDEGVAKYVESLVKGKLYGEGEIQKPPRELFGEEVRYDPGTAKSGYYVLQSKGDRERLWQYYQQGSDFMKTWNALDSSERNRGFGYAYSELIIRKYIREGGNLSHLYRNIQVNRKVREPEEKWSIYSRYLDMTPCNYESRERFESCLEDINNYDYPVYSASPSRDTGQLEIRRLEVPNRTLSRTDMINSELNSFSDFLNQFLDYLLGLVEQLLGS